MKYLIFFVVPTLLLAGFTLRPEPKADTPERPNIILILTDDQGHGDLGYHGNPLIHTPVLDSLARHSVRLTEFYVSPVCAPTRASLMTGRYGLRTGVYDTYAGGATMAAEEQTIAELLKTAGYRTGVFGKWHLGDNYPYRPNDQGFDEALVHAAGGLEQPGDRYENFSRKGQSYFNPLLEHNGKVVQAEGYCSDVFTDAAIDFVQTGGDQPFFLYLAFNAPHTPLEVPEEAYERYRDMPYPFDTFAIQGSNEFERMKPKDIEAARKVYAMVSNIDENVGRLRQALKSAGVADNTLLIFLTDNGPQQIRYKSGFYGRKGSVYEGGIRVPSFWHFPKKFGNPRDVPGIAAHIDVLPTLAELTGTTPEATLDGRSFLPALTAKVAAVAGGRTLFFQWQRGYPRGFHNMAVRTDSFKLVGKYRFEKAPDDFELFDLRTDPFETKDLSEQYPEVVQQLSERFLDWQAEMKVAPALLRDHPVALHTPEGYPVRLNRNDWKGPATKLWDSPMGHGYWTVEVPESGSYDFELFFHEGLPGHGSLNLKVGTEQREVIVRDSITQRFSFDDLLLRAGQYRLDAWFHCFWPEGAKGTYGPYDVMVKQKD
ncbi:arylsulfatase [Phaeodactylibacter xiamenensis]|uniref:arylsulfatase n=1 Tax=Phaeodactylibacter xiamenensis TaxID=1524460 RepID=UPI003CCB8186